MHTLKQFPSIVDTHEIDGEAAVDADWRATYEDMQQDRIEREQAARERLKARYGKIADGKSERSIQVIKAQPLKASRSRSSIGGRSSLGLRSPTAKPGLAIMSKAVKNALQSSTRAPGSSSISTSRVPIHPNPNLARLGKPESKFHVASTTSKFLLPRIKK